MSLLSGGIVFILCEVDAARFFSAACSICSIPPYILHILIIGINLKYVYINIIKK